MEELAAQSAKQVITSKVREAERERQYSEYKDRIGEVVNGIVKRSEFGNIILDLGKAEELYEKIKPFQEKILEMETE